MAPRSATASRSQTVGLRHFYGRVPAAISGRLATRCGIEAPDLLGRFQKVKSKSAGLQGFMTHYLMCAIQGDVERSVLCIPHSRAVYLTFLIDA